MNHYKQSFLSARFNSASGCAQPLFSKDMQLVVVPVPVLANPPHGMTVLESVEADLLTGNTLKKWFLKHGLSWHNFHYAKVNGHIQLYGFSLRVPLERF